MKAYLKLFLVAFFSFLVLFTGVYFAIEAIYDKGDGKTTDPVEVGVDGKDKDDKDKEPVAEVDLSTLESAIETSGRINVIAFGLNGMLADTMMFLSFDPEKPSIDILSIPRDTYHHVQGYNRADQKKMNAVYGFGSDNGGPNGMKRYLSEFLGVPIDYYVRVDMQAVESVVDTLGGYEVEVPYNMNYNDYAGNFHINLQKGYQTLNGNQTLQFLRFRKNDSGTIQEGDVIRIPRQQAFVKAMISKTVGENLSAVLNTVISNKYVKTDLTFEEALTYGLKAATLNPDDIHLYTIEGEAKYMNEASYWIHNPEKLVETMEAIYRVEKPEPEPETVEGEGDATEEAPETDETE
ncbi:LCP family protein [Fusibacter sp. JL298sf-3]